MFSALTERRLNLEVNILQAKVVFLIGSTPSLYRGRPAIYTSNGTQGD